MKDIISEKDLERTFSEKLNRTKKVWVIKLLSTFIKGLPDRMILCQGGYVGFAEIKTTGKKPTKIQLLIHSKLEALGFKVFVFEYHCLGEFPGFVVYCSCVEVPVIIAPIL